MNFGIISVIVLLLLALQVLRLPYICWLAIWPVAVYFFIRLGISPRVPASVLKLYLSLTGVAVFVYLCADRERFLMVKRQVTAFLVEKRFSFALYSMVILLPLTLGTKMYFDMKKEIRAATFGRTVHPPPPNEISFKGKSLNLLTAKNPFRELETKDPAQFQEHLQRGKTVYYQNCLYCHGDDLSGDGIFAHGLNPVPADFTSETILPQLQESYLFWRISKGGPGLPDEAGPWSSSMPQWEKFLAEEDIWNVILFLYDYTRFKPRAEEKHS